MWAFFIVLFFTLRASRDGQDVSMWHIFLSNLVALFATVFFGIKFLVFATWYRCTTAGNIIERTNIVFWCRSFMDLILYAFIAYVINTEKQLEGQTCIIVDDDGGLETIEHE